MNNVFQNSKTSSDLETVKSKILKRKQSIEARRMSSIPHGKYLYQGITNFEKIKAISLTNQVFQKTAKKA